MSEKEDYGTNNGIYGNFYPPSGRENFFTFYPNAKNSDLNIDTLTIYPKSMNYEKLQQQEAAQVAAVEQQLPPVNQTQQVKEQPTKEAMAA